MNTKSLICATALLISAFSGTVQAKVCKVTDPTGTRLNVRDDINGRIIGQVSNGKVVKVLDQSEGQQHRPWMYVSYRMGQQQRKGWVYREFISCY